MGKFSDSPYFILNQYYGIDFNEIIQSGFLALNACAISGAFPGPCGGFTGTGVTLIGPRTTIVTKGWKMSDFYIKDRKTNELKKIKLASIGDNPVDGNYFNFERGKNDALPSSIVGSETTITSGLPSTTSYYHKQWDVSESTSTTGSELITPGSDIYIRKDSFYHDWLENNSDYKNFINQNKLYSYFGDIYPIDNPTKYHIVFDGLKDYVMRALPTHNRTEKLTEFMRIYFDQIYNEIYNLQKNLATLIDPMEIDLNFIYYLGLMYGLNVDESLLENKLSIREFTRDIIHWLKRKGTYSSIYIIYKAICSGSLNTLNVYERWHSWPITGSPLENFEDHRYIDYYSSTSGAEFIGCAGEYYYDNTNEYPQIYSASAPSGKILSPHYKVEIDLSCEPLNPNLNEIVNENTINILLENWELTRPVMKFAKYQLLLSPKTDLSGLYNYTYDYVPYQSKLQTKAVGSESTSGTYVHIQTAPNDMWTIYNVKHLIGGTNNLVCQAFGTDQNRMEPLDMYISGDNLILTFSENVAGYACIAHRDYSSFYGLSLAWNVNHNLNQRDVISQFENVSRYKEFPLNVSTVSTSGLSATWFDNTNGRANVIKYDYIHTQSTSSATWMINHNIDTYGIIIKFYNDTHDEIFPDTLVMPNTETCIATFNSIQNGYAVIKGVGNINVIGGILPSGGAVPGDKFQINADIKIGNNGSSTFNPSGGVSNEIFSKNGYQISVEIDYYYIDISITNDIELYFNEIAIHNTIGDIIFYSHMDSIFKPKNVDLVLHYRISRSL